MTSPMFDLPKHHPIGVNAKGQGPVMPDESDFSCIVCWCGEEGCKKYE